MKVHGSTPKPQKRKKTVTNLPKMKQALGDKLMGLDKPTIGLPPLNRTESLSLNRCRVCVRNLPSTIKKQDILMLFKDYGPIKEMLVKEDQHLLILTLSNRRNAEKAVTYLNGAKYENNILIVRSYRIPAIKIVNLSKHVTNELLHLAYSIFGKIEECYVLVDRNGHCSGEGVVEFENKQSMYAAIKFCRENSYFLTSSNIPVIAEQFDPIYQHDGQPETLVKRTPSFYRERQIGPRVSERGTYDDYYAERFKDLYEEYIFAINDMKEQFFCEKRRLEIECAKVKYDEETEQLKRLIKHREKERKRLDTIKQRQHKNNAKKAKQNKGDGDDSVTEDDGEESGSALSMKLPGKPGHSGDYKAPFRAATPPPNKRQRF